MVGFDPVVLPRGVDVAGAGKQLVEDPRVDRGLVGGDLDRPAAVRQRRGEELSGRGLVASFAGEDVDDVSVLVNRPVQVRPPAGDLDVGFVDEPPVPRAVPTWPRGVDQQGREALDPSVHSYVINFDVALSEQLLDVPVRQREP
ncbi:hypothetical protein ACG83_37985 [Frankia sp. R43]|nr:hypothetical protein ACG83_37985 [Frankia sp. R43]